ncbi:DUF4823 domain-containing protein [Dongia rigui]|uniref:DUF4823 domain-containing protein n=1 Tax=Dongia rigui TaxID=940149 RepID=A0ABU5DUA7_9PROT|nr:DUF4823 domain-containing protein [Dongia rigui]MDY0870880.1 DUF4823 domain-containing protein [Dongia rigui]
MVISLTGCVSKYRLDSYEAPVSRLGKQSTFYVALPADGQYSGTTYPQSGAATAQVISSTLQVHVDKVVIGTTPAEDLTAALKQAQQRGLSHVFLATILNWEERATEWSGIPDKITLKMAVYDAQTGKVVSSTVSSASSKWGTFGGDHPQDLLPEPIKRFVDPLF